MSRLLGGRETHATSRSATRNRSTDLGPWPCRPLACLRAHADMDTNEEPTMTLLTSKIERPLTQPPPGTAWMPAPHCSYVVNMAAAPFNPARAIAAGPRLPKNVPGAHGLRSRAGRTGGRWALGYPGTYPGAHRLRGGAGEASGRAGA